MRSSPALMIFLILSSMACSKTETPVDPAGSSPATPSALPQPKPVAAASAAATAAASADSAPSASASARATPAVSAAAALGTPRAGGALAAKSATAASETTAPPAAPAGPTCGTKPLPDCPLQSWMKANTAIASASGDLPALAAALDKIAGMGPPGFPNWASISKDGATAARAGSLDAARASCTGCHKQYRDKYRAELRSRPVP